MKKSPLVREIFFVRESGESGLAVDASLRGPVLVTATLGLLTGNHVFPEVPGSGCQSGSGLFLQFFISLNQILDRFPGFSLFRGSSGAVADFKGLHGLATQDEYFLA